MQGNISILITEECNSSMLHRNLEEIFAQDYDAAYEVIVVREEKKGELYDMLEDMMHLHNNLKTTYLPDEPQYITDEEVKLLLGVKAAQNEQIIIIDGDMIPASDKWLNNVADTIWADCDDKTAHTSEQNEPFSMPVQPLLLGQPANFDKHSFFRKLSHRRNVKKLIKKWAKKEGLNYKSLVTEKNQSKLFEISFSRSQYIADPEMRNIILNHVFM